MVSQHFYFIFSNLPLSFLLSVFRSPSLYFHSSKIKTKHSGAVVGHPRVTPPPPELKKMPLFFKKKLHFLKPLLLYSFPPLKIPRNLPNTPRSNETTIVTIRVLVWHRSKLCMVGGAELLYVGLSREKV